jgi:hypothetical protein
MGRPTLVAAVVAVPLLPLAFVPSGRATTIVQVIDPIAQNSTDVPSIDESALLFNPADGVLLDVTVEIAGTYIPQVDLATGSFPTTNTLTTHLLSYPFISGNSQVFAAGVQNNVPVTVPGGGSDGVSIGAPTAVDQLVDFTSAADLAAFESGTLTSQPLFAFFFGTISSLGCTGSCDTLDSFTGTATLTYTYDVPEPPEMLVFAIGLLGVAWGRRSKLG